MEKGLNGPLPIVLGYGGFIIFLELLGVRGVYGLWFLRERVLDRLVERRLLLALELTEVGRTVRLVDIDLAVRLIAGVRLGAVAEVVNPRMHLDLLSLLLKVLVLGISHGLNGGGLSSGDGLLRLLLGLRGLDGLRGLLVLRGISGGGLLGRHRRLPLLGGELPLSGLLVLRELGLGLLGLESLRAAARAAADVRVVHEPGLVLSGDLLGLHVGPASLVGGLEDLSEGHHMGGLIALNPLNGRPHGGTSESPGVRVALSLRLRRGGGGGGLRLLTLRRTEGLTEALKEGQRELIVLHGGEVLNRGEGRLNGSHRDFC